MKWSSKFAFVLALIGSAVGLGNVWRFPYLANEYGSIFLGIYLGIILLIGIPSIYLEIFAGSNHKKPITHLAKKELGPLHFLVYLGIIMNLAIIFYYSVITGWALSFSVFSFSGMEFYEFKDSLLPALFAVLVNILAYIVLKLDFHKGLEPVNKFLVSMLFLFLLVLFVFSKPWEHLGAIIKPGGALSFETILAALSQCIFSLSIGTGLLYTYAMFSKKQDAKSASVFTAIGDTTISLIAFLTLSSLAVLVSSIANSPEEFSFVVLKNFFSSIEYGYVFSFLFFFFLFSAAFTSLISLYSLIRFNLPDKFDLLMGISIVASIVIAVESLTKTNMILLIDRHIVEPLLPISLAINLIIFGKYYLKKRKKN